MTYLQELIFKNLEKGKNFDDIVKDLEKEASAAKAKFDEVENQKKEEMEKDKRIAATRASLITSLEEYLISLGYIQQSDVTETARKNLAEVLKSVEKTGCVDRWEIGWGSKAFNKLLDDIFS